MGSRSEIISRVLYEMVGNDGLKVINALQRPMTDLQISEKTKLPITKIRTTLNLLHKYNIVSYNSCRDEDRGWFKYTWELQAYAIDNSVRNYLYSKLMKLKRELQEMSQVDFYKCENGCQRADFTLAYESNFRCSKCNGVYKPIDYPSESRKIQRESNEIKNFLKEIGVSPSMTLV